jgi:hypothetical protein
VLPALVILALASFAAALLASPHAGRPAFLHLVFAVGAMPLIFGAMTHFIPVLTRSRTAPALLAAIPLAALAAGVLVVAALADVDMAWARHAAALLGLTAAASLLGWSRSRRSGMLGQAHPGLGWYDAALVCLALALLAILAGAVWPAQAPALRRLHLHLNTLGFIGMTALGTLAVLLPTAIGKPDPQAGPWLRADLPLALGGTLLTALGAAWAAPLAWVGAVLWGITLVRIGRRWTQHYRADVFALHGSAPLLGAAWAGLTLSVVAGIVDAIPAAAAFDAQPLFAFVAGFLLPLVSGAASQLLPVWLRPGVQGPWHEALRTRLGRYGGARATLFLVSGLVAGSGLGWGLLLGAAVLIAFLLQVALALVQDSLVRKRKAS